MTLLSDITDNLDIGFIKDSFSKYVVAPLNDFGLGGFVFDIEGESIINLNAEITDNYIENNSAIQDHIALRPQELVLKNYVGEVSYRLDNSTNTPLEKLTQKLTVVNNYLPVLSQGAAQFKQMFQAGESSTGFSLGSLVSNLQAPSVSSVADIYSKVKSLTPPISKQQQAYMYFKALYEQKILVAVQTPFELIPNMAIKSIRAIQHDDSKYISEFTITLKKIRTVSFQTVPFDPADYQNRANEQNSPLQNQGNTQGQNATSSLAGFGFPNFELGTIQ